MSSRSQPPRPALSTHDPAGGHRLLRRYHEGTVQYHERRAEVRFVLDAASGRLVMPVEPGFAAASELVLHLPDEVVRHVQLCMEPSPIQRPEASEPVDRWHAYHSAGASAAMRPGPRVWLSCEITGGKCPHSPPPGEVYDPETLMRANGLRACEARLVKRVNADRDSLGRACRGYANMEVADPLCVGIDTLGMDVRARFGILRIEFDLEATGEAQAERVISAMLERT